MSDKTWNRFGRRRPYFMVGAILASLALLFMPNSPTLWIAAGMLWMMDASINVSMEPFRAFVGDMLPEKQRTSGFAMQSFFIGTGAVIASALPWVLTNWFNVSNIALDGEKIPQSVKLSFYLGGAIFLIAVLWTVFSTKEYSPEELIEFETEKKQLSDAVEIPTASSQSLLPGLIRNGLILFIFGILGSLLISRMNWEKELYVLSVGLGAFGLILLTSAWYTRQGLVKNGFVEVITDLMNMPKTMKQLAIVQFFSWFALFAMWIYATAGVTSTKYDMNLDRITYSSLVQSIDNEVLITEVKKWTNQEDIRNLEDIRSEMSVIEKKFDAGGKVVASMRIVKFFSEKNKQGLIHLDQNVENRLLFIEKEYNEGANWVDILFATYNGIAAVFAFLLPVLAKWTSRKKTHAIALVCGGIGLASFYFVNDSHLLVVSMLGVGIAWASILSMPYAILTGSLPAQKMGTYMGIFNFFIVIPQILAASILGFFTKFLFGGQAIFALILGGISLLIAAASVLFVDDVDSK
jgi:maltose/moltooligosaccharide transporter